MTNTTTPQKPPAWFEQAIRNGLAGLYVLCLENSPASEHAGVTTEFWIRDLWSSRRRDWHMEADIPCIESAFHRLRSECHRWPAPAKFWEVLPARAAFEGRSLPGRVFSLEDRRENMKRLAKIGEDLLGIKPEESQA